VEERKEQEGYAEVCSSNDSLVLPFLLQLKILFLDTFKSPSI